MASRTTFLKKEPSDARPTVDIRVRINFKVKLDTLGYNEQQLQASNAYVAPKQRLIFRLIPL